MRKRNEIVEGSFLWLQFLAFLPPLAVLAIALLGYTSAVFLLSSFVLCAGLMLYSMISTGWATDNWSRAKYQRDGDRSFAYWARLVFFGVFGAFGIFGLLLVATGHAA